MKAAVCTRYGPPDVLQIKDVAKPVPKRGEVLIKVHATAVTASDTIVRGFALPVWHPVGFLMGVVVGFRRPRNPILGLVLAGEIESTGADVNRFHPGDSVYAFTGTRFGCYAEYACVPEISKKRFPAAVPSVIAPKPANVTWTQAAALPYGGMMALHYLRRGGIQSGQHVLIYGASGAIGTAAVQFARYFGAEVTGVCSTSNVDMVHSLGAGVVIDYTKTETVPGDVRYDLVLDAVGKRKDSALKQQCKQALTPGGQYISVDDGSPITRLEDLNLLADLVEAGQFKPIIDRTYPLDQIVEAHRYVDSGHKRGNVIVLPQHHQSV